MPEGDPLSYIILLIALILLNAFFAMSEIAVITFNDTKLKRMASEGNRRAKILERMTAQPSKFLATIQVGVTLSGLLASAVAADTFTEYVVYWFRGASINPATLRMLSLIIITLLLSFVTLVFGELVPKRIAMNNPEKISLAVAYPLRVVEFITKPFAFICSAATNGILRLFGIDPNKNDREVTEEEIRMMIDEGGEDGTIEETEKEMLHNIFEFNDLEVGEVMTHRTEIEMIESDATLAEVVDVALQSGHSRIVVCDDGIDNVIGVLNVKDLLAFIKKTPKSFDVKKYMRKVTFVPETALSKDVFESFQRERNQLAVVVDEYGGTAGIVTMEDLLESIVGNIQDEYDDEPEAISPLGEDQYIVDGAASLDELEDALGITFCDVGDYDTIAGLVFDRLKRIPTADEKAEIEECGYRFTVLDVAGHRITDIKVEKLPELESADDADEKEKKKDR